MADREFTERELPDFSGFGEFGELPEDLRGMGPVSLPDGTFLPGFEGDVYQTSGGSYRSFVEPIPPSLSGNQVSFAAINYLPRANFESFRSQRFFAFGSALLPPDPTTFVDLFVDATTVISPGSPQTGSSGTLDIPSGFSAVITSFGQWIGDSTAFQKPDGSPDDIAWSVQAGGTPVFNYGNFPCMISSLDNNTKMFAIVNENTPIQVSVKNCIATTAIAARDIAVKAVIFGHMFPIDELDDVFRNR